MTTRSPFAPLGRSLPLVVCALLFTGGFLLDVAHAAQAPDGWQIPPGAADEKNPSKNTTGLVKTGKAVFSRHCQGCHGAEGAGDGPDGDPETPPADLTDPKRAAENPEGVVFYKVWNGRKTPKMPAFKSRLTKDEVWAAVEYARSLRRSPAK